jgi:hypothetical protein
MPECRIRALFSVTLGQSVILLVKPPENYELPPHAKTQMLSERHDLLSLSIIIFIYWAPTMYWEKVPFALQPLFLSMGIILSPIFQ